MANLVDRNRFGRCVVVCLACTVCHFSVDSADWPQFRGPHGSAVDPTGKPVPADVGPGQNQLWKTALPPGHSSPVIVGSRIFVTAVRDQKLLTIGLDRQTGIVQWESEAPYMKLESIHRIGSYSQSSPSADAECVVSFFGSSGLYCHDHSGKQLWMLPAAHSAKQTRT